MENNNTQKPTVKASVKAYVDVYLRMKKTVKSDEWETLYVPFFNSVKAYNRLPALYTEFVDAFEQAVGTYLIDNKIEKVSDLTPHHSDVLVEKLKGVEKQGKINRVNMTFGGLFGTSSARYPALLGFVEGEAKRNALEERLKTLEAEKIVLTENVSGINENIKGLQKQLAKADDDKKKELNAKIKELEEKRDKMIHAETSGDAFVEKSKEMLKTLFALNAVTSDIKTNTALIKDSVDNGAHEISSQIKKSVDRIIKEVDKSIERTSAFQNQFEAILDGIGNLSIQLEEHDKKTSDEFTEIKASVLAIDAKLNDYLNQSTATRINGANVSVENAENQQQTPVPTPAPTVVVNNNNNNRGGKRRIGVVLTGVGAGLIAVALAGSIAYNVYLNKNSQSLEEQVKNANAVVETYDSEWNQYIEFNKIFTAANVDGISQEEEKSLRETIANFAKDDKENVYSSTATMNAILGEAVVTRELNEIKGQVVSLNVEIEQATAQIETLTAQAKANATEIATLKGQLSEKSARVEELEAIVAAIGDSESVEEIAEELAVAKENLEIANARIAELEEANKSLTETNSAITTENSNLRTENETLTGQNNELVSSNNTLVSENAGLRTENSELTSSNNALTTENSTLKTENESLTAENSTLKTENNTLKTENDTLKTENATLTEQVNTLTSSLETANANIETLNTTIAGLNASNKDLTSQLATANEKIATLDAQIAEATKTYNTLLTNYNTAIANNESLTAQLTEARAQIESLTQQLNKAVADYETAIANNINSKAFVTSLYESVFGKAPAGMTIEQMTAAIDNALGLNYSEEGSTNENDPVAPTR